MHLSLRNPLVPLIGLCAGLLVVCAFWFSRFVSVPTTGAQSIGEGTVCDESGPLADALVRWQTLDRYTHTDKEGRFRLHPESSGHRLTAWKEGYFIGGSDSPHEIRLKPLPTEDHADYAWVDPAPHAGADHNCANCHAEIYQEWSESAHARSANGQHFLNLYQGTDWDGKAHVGWSLLDEHPLGAGVCAACHAPAIPADDPAQLDLLQVCGTAAKGVHCDFCHKISGVANGTFGLTHGRFNLKLLRPAPEADKTVHQITFGPLDDVDRGDDGYSPFYRESRYCASCHEGTVFGVPVYTTYSEWLESPARQAGKQCQTCHMRPTGAMTNFAPGHGGHERDSRTLGNHRFFAPSQEQMFAQAVTVAAGLERGDNQVRAKLRVGTGEVGHRVPTGFVDRHLVLVVEGTDVAGRPLRAITGPILPALAGPEAGQSGRVYAKLVTDAAGRGPVPFWRDDAKVTDNRLIPGRTDDLTFGFPAELHAVRVRILYRRFWPEIAAMKHWPSEDRTVFEHTFSLSGTGDKP
jgi:hypothetical protein